jgi:Osmosensitive K+ channel His kinase sensor domain
VVETHGRKQTEALLEGFEVIPRKQTVDANRISGGFDLDAALKRRPALILIDELAHTNIPHTRFLPYAPGGRARLGDATRARTLLCCTSPQWHRPDRFSHRVNPVTCRGYKRRAQHGERESLSCPPLRS